jgi:hypothetical protein
MSVSCMGVCHAIYCMTHDNVPATLSVAAAIRRDWSSAHFEQDKGSCGPAQGQVRPTEQISGALLPQGQLYSPRVACVRSFLAAGYC